MDRKVHRFVEMVRIWCIALIVVVLDVYLTFEIIRTLYQHSLKPLG